MDCIKDKEESDREARKLRELFKGRFDHETALKLIRELGGLHPAVDFVMNEKEDVVSGFLHESSAYLNNLRTDSQKVATILRNNIENTVRQFACRKCHRAWWQRVPLRKEVSKCGRCHNKYDPLPREYEFGQGKFMCPCGNEFTAFAVMNETESKCFVCGFMVPVHSMQPPHRNQTKHKSRPRFFCNGQTCYNPDHDHGHNQPRSSAEDTGSYTDLSTNYYMNLTGGRGRGRQDDDEDNYAIYPYAISTPGASQDSDQAQAGRPTHVILNSRKRMILHFSNPHISTGSTVSTFLTQGSIDTQSVSVMSELFTIDE